MRLTPRCTNLLGLLRQARWLTTGQVHARFFPHATRDAVRKRLRKLVQEKYLVMVRPHHMSEAIFALGAQGQRVLEDLGSDPVTLERKPPAQLDHLRGVNDCRIAAELEDCSYFFACWELAKLNWRHPLIPDAIFSLQGQTMAIEFDRGFEGAAFFARTKLPHYERGFPDLPCSRVLVVTESVVRMKALARAIGGTQVDILFTTVDLIQMRGFDAPIFHRNPCEECQPESLFSPSLDVKTGLCPSFAEITGLPEIGRGPIKEDRP